MKLRAMTISFEAGGKPIVFMNREDVHELGIHGLDRVKLSGKGKELIAIVDITDKLCKKGEIVANDEVSKFFKLKLGDSLEVMPTPHPSSVSFIKQKVMGHVLNAQQMKGIVQDVVFNRLSDIELTAFVTALEMNGLSIDEAKHLSEAMIDTGKKIRIGTRKKIVDKHSIGGIPGDKTSMLAVPIIASSGLIIPKTSSRSITSPAGTADRMEMLCPVEHSAEEIRKIVKKTNGCLVWGGALDLAPADDAFIQIEHPLGIDPLLLPSILSKKKSVGSKYVVIDIPTGRGAKIKTIGSAHLLAQKFIDLGKRMQMNINCAVTFGEQPLGHCMGPALEAREALQVLMGRGKGPEDIIEKITHVSGILFEMTGMKDGRNKALHILKSGKAEKKMRQIIEAQGGNPKIKPSDIPLGKYKIDVKPDREGRVLWIMNAEIAAVAKEAGAPKDQGAGLYIHKKMGDTIKKSEPVYTIYSNNKIKLNSAAKLAESYKPVFIGKRFSDKMLLSKVPTKERHRRIFMLER
jgi:AMP phosphorylase